MENRFKAARVEHNQHGPQSVKDVAKMTGITASLIDDLESTAWKPRDVGYSKIKKLAIYYGVSSDFLLGLSDTPSIKEDIQVVCKTTGLTEKAVNAIKELGESCEILNHILEESGNLWDILDDIDRLACEESTRKAAKVSADTRIDRGSDVQYEDYRDYTIKVLVQEKAEERRDVIEYRILKKFKKLLDIVVDKLTMQKEYQEYGAKKLNIGYYKEVEFFNDLDKLDKEISAEGEEQNHG